MIEPRYQAAMEAVAVRDAADERFKDDDDEEDAPGPEQVIGDDDSCYVGYMSDDHGVDVDLADLDEDLEDEDDISQSDYAG